MNDDELLRRLRALPDPPPRPAVVARTGAVARAQFEAGGPAGRRVDRMAALATAAAAVSAVAIYLTWTVQFLAALGAGG